MYLIEYEENGKDIKQITPNAPLGLIGAYFRELPISIAELLESESVEEIIEDGITKYKYIGGNE